MSRSLHSAMNCQRMFCLCIIAMISRRLLLLLYMHGQASTHPKYDSSLAAAMAEFGGRVGPYGTGGAASGQYNNGFTDSGAVVTCEACARRRLQKYPQNVHKALDSIQFIANHMASGDDSRRVNIQHMIIIVITGLAG